jgi:hypothetical protein
LTITAPFIAAKEKSALHRTGVETHIADPDVAALEALLAERLDVLRRLRRASQSATVWTPNAVSAVSADQWGLLGELAALDDRAHALLSRLTSRRRPARVL